MINSITERILFQALSAFSLLLYLLHLSFCIFKIFNLQIYMRHNSPLVAQISKYALVRNHLH